jgi:hypothetical protein
MIAFSPLPKTWLLDLDGVVFRHNGHREGPDEVLPGVQSFWRRVAPGDHIVLLTARSEAYREVTLEALARHGLRFDQILFGLPVGERILLNDRKPSGLATAFAVNLTRDQGLEGFPGALAQVDP